MITAYGRQKGFPRRFIDIHASEQTKANVLSFSEVEDTYDITYVPCKASIVHLLERDLVFKHRGKLYIDVFTHDRHVHVTKPYTKMEEERARQAYELIRNAGFPLYQEALHLVEDGNMAHMPVLSAMGI
jgi:hypothetical protein